MLRPFAHIISIATPAANYRSGRLDLLQNEPGQIKGMRLSKVYNDHSFSFIPASLGSFKQERFFQPL